MKNKKALLIVCAVVFVVASFTLFVFLFEPASVSDNASSGSSLDEGLDIPSEESVPSDFEGLYVWKKAESALEDLGLFSSQTTGSVDTQVLFFNYRQALSYRRIVSPDASFWEWTSMGSLLNAGLQVYRSGGNTLLRTGSLMDNNSDFWASEPLAVSESIYAEALGAYHNLLSPYDVNEQTVLSSSFVPSTGGSYFFSFELNEKAFEGYANALKTLNAFDHSPIFVSSTILLEVDKAFRPLSVSCEEQYKIQMSLIGETVCVSSYKEVFSYDGYDTGEEERFFSAYLDLEAEDRFPNLVGGYDILFSLFGNNRSYNLNIIYGDQTLPFHLDFDASNGIIHLKGDSLSFVYTDERYYFSHEDIRVSTDANALDHQLWPLFSLQNGNTGTTEHSRASSLPEDISVSMENGRIVLQSKNNELPFRVEIDAATMTIYRANLSYTVLGSGLQIEMEQSPVRGTIPDLTTFQDITTSMSALSMLGEMAQKGSRHYHLSVSGSLDYNAEVALTVQDILSVSAISVDRERPLDMYLNGQNIIFAYEQVQVQGTLEELYSLLSLLNAPQSGSSAERAVSTGASLIAEDGKLTLHTGDATLAFERDGILYYTNEVAICLEKNKDGIGDALEAPTSSNVLSFFSLCAFVDDSSYIQLLGAGSVYCDLRILFEGNAYPAKGCLSLGETLSLGINVDFNGEPLGIVWYENDLYISHPLADLCIPGDRIREIPILIRSILGEDAPVPMNVDGAEEPSFTVACDGETLRLVYGAFTVVLDKQGFLMETEGISVIGEQLTFAHSPVQIASPDKASCIDVYMLLNRLNDAMHRNYYSFAGSFSARDMSATINTLCLYLDDQGNLRELLAEMRMHNERNSVYRLYYDQEYIYLDAEQIKLFAWADQLLPPLMQLYGAQPQPADSEPYSFDFSAIQSVSYRNDRFSIVTENGTFVLSWKNNEPHELSVYTNDLELNLLFMDAYPIEAPSPDGYVDISAMGDLLAAVVNTVEAGSFSFEGTLDLNFLSVALSGVRTWGAFAFDGGDLSAHMLVDVPYLYGITSDNIPFFKGFNPLLHCRITSEIFLTNDTIYVSKTIVAKYGLFGTQTVELMEKRYLPLETFLSSPYELISFALNLKQDTIEETPAPVARDRAVLNPLKRFCSEGNVYALEFNAESVFPAADEICLSLITDEQYLTGAKAEVSFSVLSISGNVDIGEHGFATVLIPDQSYLSQYLSLHQ